MKRRAAPKIRPWPRCTFSLKTVWEDWGYLKHLWVYLERRAPGKFGRLEAMHAIVPKRKRLDPAEKLFASPRYRQNMLKHAVEVMDQAGVPKKQPQTFLETILKKYPAPTQEELFLERLEDPVLVLALGKRRQEISYFKTGIPELSREDMILIKQCLDAVGQRIKTEPGFSSRLVQVLGL